MILNSTHDGVLVPDKVERHFLELLLCAGHLLQWAEAVLVTPSMVEPHAPGHPRGGAHRPVGHILWQVGGQNLGAQVPHLEGLSIERHRGKHRVSAHWSLLVFAPGLATGIHHRGRPRSSPGIVCVDQRLKVNEK